MKKRKAEVGRRWEYNIISFQYPDREWRMKILDRLGDDGWELVAINANEATLKRPIVTGLVELMNALDGKKPKRDHDHAGGICWCGGMWDAHDGKKPVGPKTRKAMETKLKKPRTKR